ncbi:protoheme IX farnesyltransferase [Alphaproteobacteria bacterium KMM 3653]|uniref:Protoheme IX farnesyltransferase n=1 Tax=Harenicola maris TaxID=2841044 RepID=A0AAP2CKB5_9RHOB|nr:protoheme IX farnesyltransferase [Harenicola maris]
MSEASVIDHGYEPSMKDYFDLLKPRVMSLVVFTALVGLLVAPVGVNPFVGFVSVLFIALGAGASGALNMWWDADIDAVMSRTVKRPIPSGRVAPGEALGIGIALSGLSVIMLALAANLLAAALLAFTIFFYAVVYSMWLKRSTPQNIVIGGAAGAFPPMIGWVVATGSVSVEAWLMFMLIFLWTPPHFWALALFMKEDYHKAGVPMLTVTAGHDATRRHIFVYSVLLAIFAVAMGFSSIGGPVFLATAVILNARFMLGCYRIWQRRTPEAQADDYAVERGVFRQSLWYTLLHFTALLADAALKGAGLWSGWV